MRTSKSNNKRIGITLGDPLGIGPEVTAKALSKTSVRNNADKFVIFGDQAVFDYYFTGRYPKCRFHHCGILSKKKIVPGKPGKTGGRASLGYLDCGISALKDSAIDALVTAPLCKETIARDTPSFIGHTEYLAEAFNIDHVGMMFVGPQLRTIVVTRHIPLKEVPSAITVDNILQTLLLTHRALKINFGIKKPNIAVCGLNPHAGENGLIGKEEQTIIIPALKKAKAAGVSTIGPLPADTLFSVDLGQRYDAVVAMYHDQGLIPVKTLSFTKLVNLTIGLPFIRTSPAHGTAFDIAGKGKANPDSMCEAICLAARLSS